MGLKTLKLDSGGTPLDRRQSGDRDVAVFERWLAQGLGRAVLHLEQHNPNPYRQAILHACLHALAYDRQSEGAREAYAADLIARSGAASWLRDQLLTVLPDLPEEVDGDQVFGILGLLAAAGDTVARAGLYAAFTANAARDLPDGSEAIVRLDGVAGLLYVAAALVLDEDDAWYAGYLIAVAGEQAGADAVEAALKDAAAANTRVAAFVEAARRDRDEATVARHVTQLPRSESYESIRRRLLAGDKSAARHFQRWGQRADEQELRQVAEDLLSEDDDRHRTLYLRLFGIRPFPLDSTLLIPYARHSNPRIAVPALTALERFAHPALRLLAEELLAGGNGRGAQLLAHNFREGDYELLERLLLTWTDPEAIHALGFGLRDLVAAHPSPAAVLALLAHYEHGPCAMCRSYTVDALLDLRSAPDWLLEECRFDSYLPVRATVARNRAAERPPSGSLPPSFPPAH
jgi:hypothetical protein